MGLLPQGPEPANQPDAFRWDHVCDSVLHIRLCAGFILQMGVPVLRRLPVCRVNTVHKEVDRQELQVTCMANCAGL